MMKRSRWQRFGVGVAAVVVACAGIVGGVGESAAAPAQLPRVTTTGNDFGMFGDHAYCHGTVNVGLTSPKRGVVRVTLASHGFTGTGASWKRDRNCRVLVAATYTSGKGYGIEKFVPASFGPRAGERKTFDVATGSGLVEFSVVPYARKSAVRAPQGYGYGAYVIVP